MLTPGNSKLGTAGLIWGFGLPSVSTCPGRSATCAAHCYSARLERFRPAVRRFYAANLRLSWKPDFSERLLEFIDRHRVGVVRIHTAGDFYSPGYANRWLTVLRQRPAVRFYTYTRSWRVPAIRRVLTAMAALPQVRLWYSTDRDTGVPRQIPDSIAVAWLMTDEKEVPPRADLVFRTRRLRHSVAKRVGCTETGCPALVCPIENGATGYRTSCERCGVCWRPAADKSSRRVPLPAYGS